MGEVPTRIVKGSELMDKDKGKIEFDSWIEGLYASNNEGKYIKDNPLSLHAFAWFVESRIDVFVETTLEMINAGDEKEVNTLDQWWQEWETENDSQRDDINLWLRQD